MLKYCLPPCACIFSLRHEQTFCSMLSITSHVRRTSDETQNYPHSATCVNNRHRRRFEKSIAISFTTFAWLTSCVDRIQLYSLRFCRRTLLAIHATNQLKPLTHREPHDAHGVSSTDHSPSNHHSAHLPPTGRRDEYSHLDFHKSFLLHQAYIHITAPSSRSKRLYPHHLLITS